MLIYNSSPIVNDNMTKNKKNYIYAPLAVTGYTLFGLLLISVLISTIVPFGAILLNPQSIKLNAAVTMFSLSIGAILPVLVGYIAGSRSAKSTNKQRQRFNGVLFALLAYWIMTLFGAFVVIPSELFSDHNTRLVVMSLLPSAVVGIVAALLAFARTRGPQASRDSLEYKPFVAALVAGVLAVPLFSLINNIATNSFSLYTFIPTSIVVLFGLLSYASLRKTHLSSFMRAAWSAVSVSIVFIALYTFSILASDISSYLTPYPTMQSQTVYSILAAVLAVIGWLVYWLAQVRALSSKPSK